MLTKYKALISAVDAGSLTRAAEFMHCTQSAASRMILDLENLWSIRLLIRSKTGVRPTPECLKLLPQIRLICSTDKNLSDAVKDIRGLVSGTIRIGVFSSIATFWLPPVIADFQSRYPGIEFEMLMGDYGEIEQWVTDSRVDFGFVTEPVAAGLKSLALHDDELLAILPENHPLADRPAVEVERLAQEPLIMLEKGKRAEISRMFESRDLTPNIKFQTFDDYALLSMVESGIAVGILPRLILGRLNYRVAVRRIEPTFFRRIALIANTSAGLTSAALKFLEMFEAHLQPSLNLHPDFREWIPKFVQ